MPDKLRVGVIGCGAIGVDAHLHGYARTERAEIVAVCDADEGRANAAAAKFSVPGIYTDHRRMLAEGGLDAVSVCVPNHLHAPVALQAIAAGKHVLVEKPMGLTVDECRQLLAAAHGGGVRLMVAFTHRFHRFNQRVREMLAEGLIGRPHVFRIRFAHFGPYESWHARSPWFYDRGEAGGGALLDMGVHAIDLFRFFAGEIAAVMGRVGTLVKPIELDDTAVFILEGAAEGTLGYAEVGWGSREGFEGVEIYGDRGTIIVDYHQPVRLYLADPDQGPAGWREPAGLEGGDCFAEQMRHFVACTLENRPFLVGGEDGLKAVETALAIYESSRTGKRIRLAG